MNTYVYLVVIDPHDYERFPYTFGVYSTKEKAENAIRQAAIEEGEPALALMNDYDDFEAADCYHYPDYEGTRYYIHTWKVE